jgi:hypothetical protein
MHKESRDVVSHTRGEVLPATNSAYKSGRFVESIAGDTMIVEGTISELRHHTVQDNEKNFHRFLAVVVDVVKGHVGDTETQERVARGRKGEKGPKYTCLLLYLFCKKKEV